MSKIKKVLMFVPNKIKGYNERINKETKDSPTIMAWFNLILTIWCLAEIVDSKDNVSMWINIVFTVLFALATLGYSVLSHKKYKK